MRLCKVLSVIWVFISIASSHADENSWAINTTSEWKEACKTKENLELKDDLATPTETSATFTSVVHKFKDKRSLKTISFSQSPVWHNWEPVKNLGPANLEDAPVFLVKGPNDYWLFGKYGNMSPSSSKKRGKGQLEKPSGTSKPTRTNRFVSADATLDGFDIPLKTTADPHVYDAPGGLKKSLRGYHAWQSRDMVDWVHHGPVTEGFSKWVTTAEMVDGNAYIYYDYPNDQDPHLYIDDDLTDGQPGQNMGMAFKDPTHGSDCAMIRDLNGNFHVIYEDWSPINAKNHSWDSPLAGHAVSTTGKGDFHILAPPVDERTKPTGKKGKYAHPHWKQHPDWNTNIGEYEIHEPDQNAYGDWAAICIGGQYYLFGDDHPAGKSKSDIRVAWFTSSDINKPFTKAGTIGKGHPDPDICFAGGKFYLITQMKTDYISPGPWVETVKARVGVDTTNDGTIDHWTDWKKVNESYDYLKGFSKQVKRIPAELDLSDLPAGYGVSFEIKLEDSTENSSKPIIDSVKLMLGSN
ncbi:hypothetical protein BVX99_01265 [bacterium F16]|nr:hypothetical protein BVX99_01265 [bacterium F16]